MRATAVGLVLLAPAACSDDDKGGGATPSTPPSTATTATTAVTGSTTSTVATGGTGSTGLRAEGDTGRGSFAFRSPSGNIACAVGDSEARCDITEKSWAPPPKPADCDLDWGNSIGVSRASAFFVCAGDAVVDGTPPVLPYGGVVERGDLRCRSEEQGVTCEHRGSGHRFLVARERYELA